MKQNSFEVRPLESYDAANYPRDIDASRIGDDDDTPRLSLPLRMAVFVLMVGISLGLMACVEEYKGPPPGKSQKGDSGPTGDGDNGDYDLVLGGDVACYAGDLFCHDDQTLAVCDSYDYEYVDCTARCQQQLGGNGDYVYSLGCDVNAADPCQCQYDIIDGGIGIECLPDEAYCIDDETASICREYGFETVDCDADCQQRTGDATATGVCDASQTVPCVCDDTPEL